MDGCAKKSKYDLFVVCGVLLVLLGAGTMRSQLPKSTSTKAVGQQHQCEICGRNATSTVNIGTVVHFVCDDHAVQEVSSPENDPSPESVDQSGDETTSDKVRTIDGIAIFGPNLTDADVESIRKVIAERPHSTPPGPIDNAGLESGDNAQSKPDGESPSDLLPNSPEKRILYIRQSTENEVQVYTGELRGPRDGGGEFFRMRKTDDGWVVYKIGTWAS